MHVLHYFLLISDMLLAKLNHEGCNHIFWHFLYLKYELLFSCLINSHSSFRACFTFIFVNFRYVINKIWWWSWHKSKTINKLKFACNCFTVITFFLIVTEKMIYFSIFSPMQSISPLNCFANWLIIDWVS